MLMDRYLLLFVGGPVVIEMIFFGPKLSSFGIQNASHGRRWCHGGPEFFPERKSTGVVTKEAHGRPSFTSINVIVFRSYRQIFFRSTMYSPPCLFSSTFFSPLLVRDDTTGCIEPNRRKRPERKAWTDRRRSQEDSSGNGAAKRRPSEPATTVGNVGLSRRPQPRRNQRTPRRRATTGHQ